MDLVLLQASHTPLPSFITLYYQCLVLCLPSPADLEQFDDRIWNHWQEGLSEIFGAFGCIFYDPSSYSAHTQEWNWVPTKGGGRPPSYSKEAHEVPWKYLGLPKAFGWMLRLSTTVLCLVLVSSWELVAVFVPDISSIQQESVSF